MSSIGIVPGVLPAASPCDGVTATAENEQRVAREIRKEFYIPTLDGIRAIALLLVFLAHAGLNKVIPGAFGVTIFFFLSGYLITTLLRLEAQKTHRISLPKFYLRRAFRILPPMYVMLAVAYLIGATGALKEAGNLLGLASVSAYFYNYADLLHMKVMLPAGTSVLWSLMVEEHFYLIFPFIYLLFIRHKLTLKRQVNILLGCCLLALIWRMVLVYLFRTPTSDLVFPRWTYSASDARFDAILFGCILAIRNNFVLNDPSPMFRKHKGLFAVLGLGVLFVTFLIREPHFRETLRYTLDSAALYPIFYYCVSSADGWTVRWLEWKPLRYLGWVSYSMYLFHYVLMGWGQDHFHSHLFIVGVVSFGLTLLYAWLVRILIELPSRRWKAGVERRIFAKT